MERLKSYWIATITMLAFVVFAIPGHALAKDILQEIAGASVLEEIKKRGSVKVGFASFVPWAMVNSKGELIGFEVEVAKQFADDSKWKLDSVQTAWDGIIPALLAGKFDLIIGGMSVMQSRNKTVNFSIPYAASTIGVAASPKLAKGWSTLEDFNKKSVTIVVRRGSSNIPWMRDTFPNATQRYFDDDAQAFQEVMNGNAHAVISAEPKPTLWSKSNSEVLFQPFGDRTFIPKPSAFATRKGDHDWLNYLNNWIRVRTLDGWLTKRRDYWFGTTDWFEQMDPKKNPFAKK